MFGVARKKSKATIRRSADAESSSDEDNNIDGAQQQHLLRAAQKQQQQQQRRKKKDKKKKKTTKKLLSFDPDDEAVNNDNDDTEQKKSKKRKKHSTSSTKKHKKRSGNGAGGGLGYGGVGIMNTSDGSSSSEGGGDCQYYDESALDKLRREQKRSMFVKDNDDNDKKLEQSMDNTDKDINMVMAPEYTKDDAKEEESKEEEFISLSDKVLTGDEAMAFAQREEDGNDNNLEFDHGLQSPPTPPPTATLDNDDKLVGKKVAGIDINEVMMDIENEPTNEVDEGNQKWEDITARRAGVLPPKAAKSNNSGGNLSRRQQGGHSSSNSSSLGQIRASLQPTISNLDNIYSDLESSITRHESAISSTRDELSTKESTLVKHGKALEYYQGLREDLATWMGALRELNSMVTRVEKAKCKLEAEMTWRRIERFVEWGKDCTEVLQNKGLLKIVLTGENSAVVGTSNDGGIQATTPAQVDEFGRDLSMVASLSRVKRWNQRRKRSINRLQDTDESALDLSIGCYTNEDNIDAADIDEWKRRHDALVQAIDIIPNLVKDDYLSISNLCKLFHHWESTYPEDYANCYADYSLIQMISVLVRLELCSRLDVLELYSEPPQQSTNTQCLDVSEFKWFQDLKKSYLQPTDETMPPKSILLEIVQKQIVRRLLDAFSFEDGRARKAKQKCGVYDPFSAAQTKRMCTMFKSVIECSSGSSTKNGKAICEETAEKVLNALLSLVKNSLKTMAVPIVDSTKVTMVGNQCVARDGPEERVDRETVDAITYANIIQANAMCALVNNVLEHWYPILTKQLVSHQVAALVQYTFADIISLRILPILHLLHDVGNNETCIVLAKTSIKEILETLRVAGLYDKDEWMLFAAPLRAAAEQWK